MAQTEIVSRPIFSSRRVFAAIDSLVIRFIALYVDSIQYIHVRTIDACVHICIIQLLLVIVGIFITDINNI